MKIGLILNPISEKKPAGLARSVYQFALNLMKVDSENQYVLITKNQIDLSNLFGESLQYEYRHLGGDSIWATLKLHGMKDIDTFVFFTPVVPILLFKRNIITFAHDFAYMTFGSFFQRVGEWVIHFLSFHKSTFICAVSEYTRDELLRFFPVSKEKVQVIYNGFDHVEKQADIEIMRENFFLMVGVVKERKNTLNAVMAFEKFCLRCPEYQFKIVGSFDGPYGQKVLSYIKKQNLDSHIKVLGHVSDDELYALYKTTTAVLFPSLVEGFGFPILESMAYGTPVITSNIGALKETSGNAAVLVDPVNTDSILDGLEFVLDEEKRTELIRRGQIRIKDFPWRESAQKLFHLIQKAK